MTIVSALATINLVLAAVIAVVWIASQLVRRRDAVLWHTVWTAVVVAAIGASAAALGSPAVIVAVPDGALARVGVDEQLARGDAGMLQAGLVIYALVSGLFLVRLVAGLLLVRRITRQSYPVEGHWRTRLQRLIGPDADRCVMHPRVQVPLTIGVRRSVVLLPESWIAWTDERVIAVLRHELSHVSRRDYVWNVAAALTQALYWPNPLVWLATARLRLTAELACDREASVALGPAAYAGVLVASAREFVSTGHRAARLAPGAGGNLDARVRALLSRTGAGTAAPRGLRLLIAGLVAAAIVFAAVVDVAPASAAGPPGTAIRSLGHELAHAARHRH
jgi:beta-lactamase regulating signal transducer with metallopeptidase domain